MGGIFGGGEEKKKTLGEQKSPDMPNIEGPGGLDDSPRLRSEGKTETSGGDTSLDTKQESTKSGEKTAGDSLADAGMASGNPYAMAAGAALKVLGARAKRQKERTAALMNSVNAQQSNMAKGAQAMTNVSSGFRL